MKVVGVVLSWLAFLAFMVLREDHVWMMWVVTAIILASDYNRWLESKISTIRLLLLDGGFILNLLAIATNGGYMPVLATRTLPWERGSALHHIIASTRLMKLWFLCDVLPGGFSVGDVLILCSMLVAILIRVREMGSDGGSKIILTRPSKQKFD